MAKKFYIKERINPQFEKSYYVACGQLTKKEVKEKSRAAYGDNFMIPYETEEEYNAAIEKFKAEGFSIKQ